jgi:hypothetical protein
MAVDMGGLPDFFEFLLMFSLCDMARNDKRGTMYYNKARSCRLLAEEAYEIQFYIIRKAAAHHRCGLFRLRDTPGSGATHLFRSEPLLKRLIDLRRHNMG